MIDRLRRRWSGLARGASWSGYRPPLNSAHRSAVGPLKAQHQKAPARKRRGRVRAELHRLPRDLRCRRRRADRHSRRPWLGALEDRSPARLRLRPLLQGPQDHRLRAAPHDTRLRARRREFRSPGRRRVGPRRREFANSPRASLRARRRHSRSKATDALAFRRLIASRWRAARIAATIAALLSPVDSLGRGRGHYDSSRRFQSIRRGHAQGNAHRARKRHR